MWKKGRGACDVIYKKIGSWVAKKPNEIVSYGAHTKTKKKNIKYLKLAFFGHKSEN